MRHLAALASLLGVACTFDPSGGGSQAATISTSGAELESSSSAKTTATDESSGSSQEESAEVTAVTTEPSSASVTTTGDATGTDDSTSTSTESTGASPTSPWCDPTWTDLAACYSFADLAAGVLVDGSAAQNDGTVAGIGIEAGPTGDAAVFSADSQISVPAHPATDLSSALTMELFLRIDAIPGSGRVGVLDRDGQWSLFLFSDGQLRCGAATFTYWQVATLGAWMHVGCVVGDGYARLYIDGALVSETADPGPIATGSTNPLAIGDNSPGFDESLPGAISGVRVWSVTRTAEQLCEAAGELCP